MKARPTVTGQLMMVIRSVTMKRIKRNRMMVQIHANNVTDRTYPHPLGHLLQTKRIQKISPSI